MSDKKVAICHETDAMKSIPVNIEKLSKTVTIVLDKEKIRTKKEISMRDAEQSKRPSASMVNERTTTIEPDLITANYSRPDNNDNSSDMKALLKAAEGSSEVYRSSIRSMDLSTSFLLGWSWKRLLKSTI